MGAHILKDDMKDTCRFCGESVGICSIKIVNGSGRGKVTIEVSNSGCDYFEKFSIAAAAKGSKKSPYTNHPVRCKISKRVFWSCNIYNHLEICYSDYPKAEWVINEEEKVALSKILK